MDQFAKETLPISLEEEMRRSYIEYAMSVIVGRALPDVRDGLTREQRVVLYVLSGLAGSLTSPVASQCKTQRPPPGWSSAVISGSFATRKRGAALPLFQPTRTKPAKAQPSSEQP